MKVQQYENAKNVLQHTQLGVGIRDAAMVEAGIAKKEDIMMLTGKEKDALFKGESVSRGELQLKGASPEQRRAVEEAVENAKLVLAEVTGYGKMGEFIDAASWKSVAHDEGIGKEERERRLKDLYDSAKELSEFIESREDVAAAKRRVDELGFEIAAAQLADLSTLASVRGKLEISEIRGMIAKIEADGIESLSKAEKARVLGFVPKSIGGKAFAEKDSERMLELLKSSLSFRVAQFGEGDLTPQEGRLVAEIVAAADPKNVVGRMNGNDLLGVVKGAHERRRKEVDGAKTAAMDSVKKRMDAVLRNSKLLSQFHMSEQIPPELKEQAKRLNESAEALNKRMLAETEPLSRYRLAKELEKIEYGVSQIVREVEYRILRAREEQGMAHAGTIERLKQIDAQSPYISQSYEMTKRMRDVRARKLAGVVDEIDAMDSALVKAKTVTLWHSLMHGPIAANDWMNSPSTKPWERRAHNAVKAGMFIGGVALFGAGVAALIMSSPFSFPLLGGAASVAAMRMGIVVRGRYWQYKQTTELERAYEKTAAYSMLINARGSGRGFTRNPAMNFLNKREAFRMTRTLVREEAARAGVTKSRQPYEFGATDENMYRYGNVMSINAYRTSAWPYDAVAPWYMRMQKYLLEWLPCRIAPKLSRSWGIYVTGLGKEGFAREYFESRYYSLFVHPDITATQCITYIKAHRLQPKLYFAQDPGVYRLMEEKMGPTNFSNWNRRALGRMVQMGVYGPQDASVMAMDVPPPFTAGHVILHTVRLDDGSAYMPTAPSPVQANMPVGKEEEEKAAKEEKKKILGEMLAAEKTKKGKQAYQDALAMLEGNDVLGKSAPGKPFRDMTAEERDAEWRRASAEMALQAADIRRLVSKIREDAAEYAATPGDENIAIASRILTGITRLEEAQRKGLNALAYMELVEGAVSSKDEPGSVRLLRREAIASAENELDAAVAELNKAVEDMKALVIPIKDKQLAVINAKLGSTRGKGAGAKRSLAEARRKEAAFSSIMGSAENSVDALKKERDLIAPPNEAMKKLERIQAAIASRVTTELESQRVALIAKGADPDSSEMMAIKTQISGMEIGVKAYLSLLQRKIVEEMPAAEKRKYPELQPLTEEENAIFNKLGTALGKAAGDKGRLENALLAVIAIKEIPPGLAQELEAQIERIVSPEGGHSAAMVGPLRNVLLASMGLFVDFSRDEPRLYADWKERMNKFADISSRIIGLENGIVEDSLTYGEVVVRADMRAGVKEVVVESPLVAKRNRLKPEVMVKDADGNAYTGTGFGKCGVEVEGSDGRVRIGFNDGGHVESYTLTIGDKSLTITRKNAVEEEVRSNGMVRKIAQNGEYLYIGKDGKALGTRAPGYSKAKAELDAVADDFKHRMGKQGMLADAVKEASSLKPGFENAAREIVFVVLHDGKAPVRNELGEFVGESEGRYEIYGLSGSERLIPMSQKIVVGKEDVEKRIADIERELEAPSKLPIGWTRLELWAKGRGKFASHLTRERRMNAHVERMNELVGKLKARQCLAAEEYVELAALIEVTSARTKNLRTELERDGISGSGKTGEFALNVQEQPGIGFVVEQPVVMSNEMYMHIVKRAESVASMEVNKMKAEFMLNEKERIEREATQYGANLTGMEKRFADERVNAYRSRKMSEVEGQISMLSSELKAGIEKMLINDGIALALSMGITEVPRRASPLFDEFNYRLGRLGEADLGIVRLMLYDNVGTKFKTALDNAREFAKQRDDAEERLSGMEREWSLALPEPVSVFAPLADTSEEEGEGTPPPPDTGSGGSAS
mgnify:CR=1 FL=1